MSDLQISRALFLKIRMAYMHSMRGESHQAIMDACNLHDEGQVQLLMMTPVNVSDGTCDRDMAWLLAAWNSDNRITDLESQLAAAREEQAERIAYCSELQRVTHDLVSSVLRSDAAIVRRDAEEVAGALACSTSNCDGFAARLSGGMIVCDLCRAGMNAILEVEAKGG